jgi:hypothetical protein
MEYAASLTRSPSRKTLVAPLVALVLGAGVATGAYALIDDGGTTTQSKVIVVERPAANTADIPGKNEAGTAAAITHASPTTVIPGKNEAATAAAISQQSGGIELRGSKASSTGTQSPGSTASDRTAELRSDPHGPAISLRNP